VERVQLRRAGLDQLVEGQQGPLPAEVIEGQVDRADLDPGGQFAAAREEAEPAAVVLEQGQEEGVVQLCHLIFLQDQALPSKRMVDREVDQGRVLADQLGKGLPLSPRASIQQLGAHRPSLLRV